MPGRTAGGDAWRIAAAVCVVLRVPIKILPISNVTPPIGGSVDHPEL